MKDKLTYETESAYADFRKISIEFDGDSRTSDVVELCRRLLVAAGHHPDNVRDMTHESKSVMDSIGDKANELRVDINNDT